MTKKLQLYSLNQIEKIYGKEALREMVNNFKCERNKPIERFVVNGEMECSHKRYDYGRVVSYFILDHDDKFLGFFSLYIKAFLFNDRKPDDSKPVFYIACLARHDEVSCDELNMKDILDLAFGKLYTVKEIIGGISTVMVDTDVKKLKDLYTKNNFIEITNPKNDNFLLIMELSDTN